MFGLRDLQMDLPRSYPGSAFTEYYGNSGQNNGSSGAGSQYPFSYAEYARTTPYAAAAVAAYDATRAAAANTLVATPFTTKPTLGGSDAFTSPTWTALQATPWDPKLSGGAGVGGVGGAEGLLSRAMEQLHGMGGGVGVGPPLGLGAPVPHQHPKRKRKTTPAQRTAANVRERRRMSSLNQVSTAGQGGLGQTNLNADSI